LAIAGSVVILTGIALGTIFGPIRTWDTLLYTPYGILWLTALIVAIFTPLWGMFVGYKYAMSIISNEGLWNMAADGNRNPLRIAFIKASVIEGVEAIGFIVLIICMVLI